MAITAFKITISLTPVSHYHKAWIKDNTDWAAQSVSLSDLNGNVKVTSPSGVVIHDNTDFSDGGCDMPSVQQHPGLVTLPLTTLGVVQPGEYTFLYTVYNKLTTQYYTYTRKYAFTYVSPVIDIDQTVGYDAPLFTSTDATDYSKVGLTLNVFTRSHVLNYPFGSPGQGSPITSTAAVIQTPTFYPGTQTTVVSADLVYYDGDVAVNGTQINDYVTATREVVVSTNDLCSYYCCLKKFYEKLKKAKCSNCKTYSGLQLLAGEIAFIMGMIEQAKECGHTNDVADYIDQIKDLVGCSDDCDDCN